MHRHRAVTSANFSTPHWSNQMSRIHCVGPTSTKCSCLDLWCRHLLRLKRQETSHRFLLAVLLTTPFASLFDQSPIPMLSTAHPFVNHHTLKWKVFHQKKYQCCCTFLVMSQLVVQRLLLISPEGVLYSFSHWVLRPTNLNTQSSPDQPCKSTKISTNRGSRPCFCSENILQPPLPCSKLTHPAEECRSVGISWQNDNLAGQLLGFKMVLFNWFFLGWGHHQQRCHHPPRFTFFPPKKFIRSHKTTKIDGASKSHLMGLIRQLCEKLPDQFPLKSYNKITTVKIWIALTHKLHNHQEWRFRFLGTSNRSHWWLDVTW